MCGLQGGSIFSKIRLIVSEPSAIPQILGSALTTSSNFFINYVIIQVRHCSTSCCTFVQT